MRRSIHSSSTMRSSPVERSASRERFPKRNEASRKSFTQAFRVLGSKNPTENVSSITDTTSPVSMFGYPPFVRTVTFKTVLDFFHIRNLSNASTEEAIFLHVLYSSLATQARMLAAILPWSLERPLRALFAAMNESGKSYTKRNAKRKRPSNSPASLRKRSSGA